MVISAVATDKNAPWNGIQAPIFIGLFIFAAATVFGPLTGGSFNPAVSLAPAITAGEFGNVWIYLIGPDDRRCARRRRLQVVPRRSILSGV